MTDCGGDNVFEVIMTTCPSQKVGRRIAEALVSARAAACVNMLGGVTSFYRWKGGMNEDREVLLVAKTGSDRRSEAQRIILENHPYELPEVVILPIAGGNDKYLRWLAQETEISQGRQGSGSGAGVASRE